MNDVKGFLIDPLTRTVEPVTLSGDYTAIYPLIGAQTFDVVRLDEGDGIYIDDEGLLKDTPGPFFALRGHDAVFAGRGLVLGSNDDGETVDAKITLDALKARLLFPVIMFAGHEEIVPHEIDHPVLGKMLQCGSHARFVPVSGQRFAGLQEKWIEERAKEVVAAETKEG